MDGTENLNGNLPSLPEILEVNRKMRNPGNRDNPKNFGTDRKQIGKQQTRKKSKAHDTKLAGQTAKGPFWKPAQKRKPGTEKTKKFAENGKKTTCSGDSQIPKS